jgi:hypothetical protein
MSQSGRKAHLAARWPAIGLRVTGSTGGGMTTGAQTADRQVNELWDGFPWTYFRGSTDASFEKGAPPVQSALGGL